MDLYKLTAHELTEKLKNKEVKAVEIAESIFKRIDETEERIGSFVTLRKEKAMAEAAKVDEKIAKGETLKTLEGIPVALKDNMVSLGDLSTASSKNT